MHLEMQSVVEAAELLFSAAAALRFVNGGVLLAATKTSLELEHDCCIRLRYSLMESLRLGCGGGSGAESCGFKRGSWLAVLVSIFKGTAAAADWQMEWPNKLLMVAAGAGMSPTAAAVDTSFREHCVTKPLMLLELGLLLSLFLFKPNRAAVCDT